MVTNSARIDAAAPFEELDVVRLRKSVRSDEGPVIPARTRGTIVHVHSSGEAFLVEFAKPFPTVVTVMPEALEHDAG